MLLTSSITVGIIRLAIIWLFLFYCNKRAQKYNKELDFIDFIVNKWLKYGSITLLIIFVLILINIYDLFNTLFVLSIIILFDYYGFKNIKHIYKLIKKKIKISLLFILKNIENRQPLSFWLAIKSKRKQKKKAIKSVLLVTILSVIAFVFRIYFYKYDSYLLSELWAEDLIKTIQFNYHDGFLDSNFIVGEHIMLNFYSSITNVSPEIALQTFGVLQTMCLSIILMWGVKHIGGVKYVIPFISSLIFILFIVITPINLHFITQHQSIFLALTLALPLMVYLLTPNLLIHKFKPLFIYLVLIFLAIGLINLFTFLLLVSPFLLIVFLLPSKITLRHRIITILAYTTSFLIILGIYWGIDDTISLGKLIRANLISITSFTYTPHLILPYNQLIQYLHFMSLIGILIIVKLYLINKQKNWESLVFLVYYFVVTSMTSINFFLIDDDLLYIALIVLSPFIFGLNLMLFSKLLSPLLKNQFILRKYIIPLVLLISLASFAYTLQKDTINNLKEANHTSREILDAYDKISMEYMPYTYAVVNDDAAFMFSSQKHFFINYKDFTSSYLAKDSVYQVHKNNKKILNKNPEYVIPQTVFLFVYDDKKSDFSKDTLEDIKLMFKARDQLGILKGKGRNVALFYESETVKVYEIVNKPKSSKITDLIY